MPPRRAATTAICLALAACDPSPGPRPDIVVFVADALRADALPVYGHDRATAPRLDALAKRGLVFERAFSHSSWTLPAFASLLTGRVPSEHRAVRDPTDHLRFGRLDPDLPTLATLLGAAGWRTGAWVNNVFLAPEFGLASGFDTWDYVGATGTAERSGLATVDAALAWLDAASGPALVVVHVMEPHLPYLAPPGGFAGPPPAPFSLPFGDAGTVDALMRRTLVPDATGQAWIRAAYDEDVLAADRALGHLLDGLEARGRREDAVLAVTADHGEEFWDHGGFEHGHTLYGELLRVPLVLVAPDVDPGRVAVPVQHADLFRTILDLAGVTAPADAAGTDLRLLAAAPSAAPRPLLSEDCLYGPARLAVTRGDERLIVNLETRVANLFQLDAGGQSDLLVPEGPDLEAGAAPLLEAAFELRGDLERRPPPEVTAPLDDEAFEHLRALGYLR